MSTRRLHHVPRRRWTAARWSPLRRGAPRPNPCGRWPSPVTPQRPAGSLVASPSGGLRVESAAAPERGLFETVLGSLLGFVL